MSGSRIILGYVIGAYAVLTLFADGGAERIA